jgi:hypothetical protein
MQPRTDAVPRDAHPPIRQNPGQKDELAVAMLVGWVIEHRRLAMFLSRLLGTNGRETRRLLQDPDLIRQIERNLPVIRARIGLPDRFNASLGPLGWLAYEEMDADVAEEATTLAEAGELEDAEAVLVRYLRAENVAQGIERLCKELPVFEARRPLLMKAVEDHREGRFHASVPVILAQIDGVVHDLTGRSFFVSPKKAATHLLARDTFAGHPSGLATMSALMSQRREPTSTSEIGIPHRHGILHGRDLGYDNERVSAKSFAMILALGSWAVKVERGEQHLDPPLTYFDPANIGFRDLVRELRAAAGVLFSAWFFRSRR